MLSKVLNLSDTKARTTPVVSSLSRNVLNWKPILDLENTLKMTIDWYKNYNKDIICSKDQLSEYTKLLQDSINN